jgi:hypothetical protein
MASDRTTPMRALVGARAVRRRAGEHALARALGDERSVAAVEQAAVARRDAAAAALHAAITAARELVAHGADATTLAIAHAFATRRRRQLAEAEADLAAARARTAEATAVTGDQRRELGSAMAEHEVASRALDRATTEARRARERREED